MAIPSKQIGWTTTENLLWYISKQLEILIKMRGHVNVSPSNAYIITENDNSITSENGDNLIIN
jgi:hypothetical protein